MSASIHVLEQFFRQFKDMRFIGQNPVGCFGAGYGLEVMESDFQRQGGSGEVILFKPGYQPIDDAFERFFEFLQISFVVAESDFGRDLFTDSACRDFSIIDAPGKVVERDSSFSELLIQKRDILFS